MIELLKDWVRNLITIVIFANILEMLLPDSAMRKYVKVVMGFFILLTLLNPLLNILDVNLTVFSVFDDYSDRRQQQIIHNSGKSLEQQNHQLALQTYQKQLEQQIKALILTQPEIEDVQVRVKADQQGKIETVDLKLYTFKEMHKTTASTKAKQIKGVEIKVNPEIDTFRTNSRTEDKERQFTTEEEVETETTLRIKDKTVKLVMSFYNLKAEAISIQ